MDAHRRIARLLDWVEEAKAVPFSTSVMLNRDTVADELEALRDELPAELREAQHIIADRDDVLARAEREAERTVADAELERQRLVHSEEVHREAQRQAEDLLADARERAREVRLEADDYIDEKLAGFEIVLHKTLATVERGRGRLARRLDPDMDGGDPDMSGGEPGMPGGDPGGGRAASGQPPPPVAEDADTDGELPSSRRPLYDHEAL